MTSILEMPIDCLDSKLPLEERVSRLKALWPDLHDHGFRHWRDKEEDFRRNRVALGNPDSIVAIRHCMRLMANAPRTATPRVNSYALKHRLEEVIGRYVSNGNAIAACVLLGGKATNCAPNASLDISPQWLKALELVWRGVVASRIPGGEEVPEELGWLRREHDRENRLFVTGGLFGGEFLAGEPLNPKGRAHA